MTREEKEQTGKYVLQMARLLEDGCYQQKMLLKAVHIIDEALEQEPQTFKWCETCKEYDQEKHCCHRWSKVIRDTVEEMKQEYIEREVLDKIRAEIIELRSKQNVGVLECLDIIDKYKAEMEQKDGND